MQDEDFVAIRLVVNGVIHRLRGRTTPPVS